MTKPKPTPEEKARRAAAKAERAAERQREAQARAARQQAKRARKDAFDAAMGKALDRIAADAPKVSKRWKEERAREAKRLKKRKQELRKRVYKDQGGAPPPDRPDWLTRPVTLPDPVKQPDPAEIADNVPPVLIDRPELMPGTFRLFERDGLLDRDPLPPRWTARHVAQRLKNAFATLNAMPERDRPRGHSALWPAYRHEAGELASQAGAGVLAIGRNVVRPAVAAAEVALMDEALGWISRFCADFWPNDRRWLIAWCDDPDSLFDGVYTPVEYFELIARKLNERNEVVR